MPETQLTSFMAVFTVVLEKYYTLWFVTDEWEKNPKTFKCCFNTKKLAEIYQTLFS